MPQTPSDQLKGASELASQRMILFPPQASQLDVEKALGVRVILASDFKNSAVRRSELAADDALFLDHIGVAIVSTSGALVDRLMRMTQLPDHRVVAIEPVGTVLGLGNVEDHLPGYRDASESYAGRISEDVTSPSLASAVTNFDESQATWGIQAVGAVQSRFSGAGVRVAVLDTGFELRHPDFYGTAIAGRGHSFVNEDLQDNDGHGTHCAGTICGPQNPNFLPRYGVAPEVDLYVGRVLDSNRRGTDADVLAGINWALANGCHIASLSLGSEVARGVPFSIVYEGAARRALDAGMLLIAAAGNDSSRTSQSMQPVWSPADCLSVLAVGSIDSQMQMANDSNSGLNPSGGGIDLVGPGVSVRSSWKWFSPFAPQDFYETRSGTSMAAPHVAGVAALWVHAEKIIGLQLWRRLIEKAEPLPLTVVDAGAGLVKAP